MDNIITYVYAKLGDDQRVTNMIKTTQTPRTTLVALGDSFPGPITFKTINVPTIVGGLRNRLSKSIMAFYGEPSPFFPNIQTAKSPYGHNSISVPDSDIMFSSTVGFSDSVGPTVSR